MKTSFDYSFTDDEKEEVYYSVVVYDEEENCLHHFNDFCIVSSDIINNDEDMMKRVIREFNKTKYSKMKLISLLINCIFYKGDEHSYVVNNNFDNNIIPLEE